MLVLGMDFTSSPSRKKPLVCVRAKLQGNHLDVKADDVVSWPSFTGFEFELKRSGPWIAGIDFPFGQSKTFLENSGWPMEWSAYVSYVQTFNRKDFCNHLNQYKADRGKGDKEHRRATDCAAGAISPQKLYGVPVGKMFFEGAPRLLQAGVSIPHLLNGDESRVVVESYPGILVRTLIGKVSYKQDVRSKHTPAHHDARQRIFRELKSERAECLYGITLTAPDSVIEDHTGDKVGRPFVCRPGGLGLAESGIWIRRSRQCQSTRRLDL